ncbi:hypothetical protein VTH8203_02160 [Vibrio thalassae]|uniref:Uncharacterized protein n=1 Tax=Vibrio thalassae TaxID=1243014 RepID=A0A240EIM1_9VIBR|nr:hypothetical protein VTH8203_02160 [Vibrio thalassae]
MVTYIEGPKRKRPRQRSGNGYKKLLFVIVRNPGNSQLCVTPAILSDLSAAKPIECQTR